jgi:hypothetical protein
VCAPVDVTVSSSAGDVPQCGRGRGRLPVELALEIVCHEAHADPAHPQAST